MTAAGIRVLITGSREFSERAIVAAALTLVHREHPGVPITVIVGGARGADRVAAGIARQNPGRLIEEEHLANWTFPDGSKNKLAGFERNQRMVDTGADVCLAFLQLGERNSGTRDCVRRAVRAGIPVREHWSTPAEIG